MTAYEVGGDDAQGGLLIRIRNGDVAAFNALYRENSSVLMALIVRVVRDTAVAEEVLQECFVEVWTKTHSFDPSKGSGRGWLVGLCRRRAIDRVRSIEASRKRDELEHRRAEADEIPSVETIVEAVLDSEAATSALKTLPRAQAQLLYLSYYQGLSHQQISAALDRPLGTVKSQIRDGMKRLRREMGEAK